MADTEDGLKAIAETIAAHDIDTVEIAYPDTQGHMRGKQVPARHFLRSAARKGVACADAAYIWDHRAVLFESPLISAETGYSDMLVIPDLPTFKVLPWREGTARVIGETISHSTHKPHALDPRGAVRRQVERLESIGYTAMVATEVEFYLMTPDHRALGDSPQCYTLATYPEMTAPMRAVRRALEALGLEIEGSNAEYGPAQIELNVGPRDPITACDEAMYVKHTVKEIVRDHGLRAVFMAKPIADQSGNGLHTHISLQQDGKNAFTTDCTNPGPITSSRMRNVVGGLCEHAPSLSLIGMPTPNAYKRLVPYSFAPMSVNWSLDNRCALVRCMPDVGNATRVEFRGAAADANPYLVVASILAATIDGVERGLQAGPIAEGDLYARVADYAQLPTSLEGAIEAFEGSRMAELIGSDVAVNLCLLARHELAQWRGVVTDWEIERYADNA